MDEKEFLKTLSENHGPSSKEYWLHDIITDAFSPYGKVYKGNLNNIYVCKKGSGKKNKSILVSAHLDEVFLIVKNYSKNGFLEFMSHGIDAETLVSCEVVIHGKEPVTGVIGVKPPHITSKEELNKALTAKDLLIDTGYSNESLKELVSIGDLITIKRNFNELLNGFVSGKAFDDRASVVSMYHAMKLLNNSKHDLDVNFLCSCQEETGLIGAKIGSYTLKPDIAIAIDVTFDNGPFGDAERDTEMLKGPAICVGPNIHPKLRKKLIEISKENNIPYQIEVSEGHSGTDAWSMQISGGGVPTVLLSIPLRYMHSSVEVVNMEDIKNTGLLLSKFIECIKEDELEEYLCF